MLKHVNAPKSHNEQKAATFGWLCVETLFGAKLEHLKTAATFGWLCVETLPEHTVMVMTIVGSRLRAAVC